MFYWFVKGMFHPFVRLYPRQTREGLEHLPRTGPAIIIANHSSYADPVVLGSASPRPIHFVVLQRMFDLMVLRWFYWGMGTIPVRIEGQDSRGIKRALRVLSRGGVLGIFPEGTRSPDGSVGEARPGAAMIAALSGAPVIPAYIDGANEALPIGAGFPRPIRVNVKFGPPLHFERHRGRQGREALLVFSRAMLDAVRRLEPAS